MFVADELMDIQLGLYSSNLSSVFHKEYQSFLPVFQDLTYIVSNKLSRDNVDQMLVILEALPGCVFLKSIHHQIVMEGLETGIDYEQFMKLTEQLNKCVAYMMSCSNKQSDVTINTNKVILECVQVIHKQMFYQRVFQYDKVINMKKQLSASIEAQNQRLTRTVNNKGKQKQNKNQSEKKGLNEEIIEKYTEKAIQLSLSYGPFKETLREQLGEDYESDTNDYTLA